MRHYKNFKKIGLLIFLFFCFFYIYFYSTQTQAVSQDAIAVRVIPNPEHMSAFEWYRSRDFKGSPQALTIDGYKAVRDGRTVYVNAANVIAETAGKAFYTNIYIISYNQQAENMTIDVFSQILKNWKLNTNLPETALCSDFGESLCLSDSDCALDAYCLSNKAAVTRDTIRLEGLYRINRGIREYYLKNGLYPKLSAGSYLSNRTISVWPSWQSVLSQELGFALPLDPVNRLGSCGEDRFHKVTCWDEAAGEFADANPSDPDLNLPGGSRVFKYEAAENGRRYTLCAVMESGFLNASGEVCAESEFGVNTNPSLIRKDFPPKESGVEYSGFVSVSDPDGDPLTWTITPSPLPTWNGWSGPLEMRDTGDPLTKKFYAAKTGETGDYYFKLRVSDDRGGAVETDIKISIVKFCELPWGGKIAGGESISAYQDISVPCKDSCSDIEEKRYCDPNTGILSGTYTNNYCKMTPCLDCYLPWGGKIVHNDSREAYKNPSEHCEALCEKETRVCDNGTLLGSFENKDCYITPCFDCDLPWGEIIKHNESRPAYLRQIEPCEVPCDSEIRICKDGQLQGDERYIYKTCENEVCLDCEGPSWAGTVLHRETITAYKNPLEVCDVPCEAENRLCFDGALSGTYLNQSCSAPCKDCPLPWGGAIVHRESVLAYKMQESCDCQPVERECRDGTLAGLVDYIYPSCSEIICDPGFTCVDGVCAPECFSVSYSTAPGDSYCPKNYLVVTPNPNSSGNGTMQCCYPK